MVILQCTGGWACCLGLDGLRQHAHPPVHWRITIVFALTVTSHDDDVIDVNDDDVCVVMMLTSPLLVGPGRVRVLLPNVLGRKA